MAADDSNSWNSNNELQQSFIGLPTDENNEIPVLGTELLNDELPLEDAVPAAPQGLTEAQESTKKEPLDLEGKESKDNMVGSTSSTETPGSPKVNQTDVDADSSSNTEPVPATSKENTVNVETTLKIDNPNTDNAVLSTAVIEKNTKISMDEPTSSTRTIAVNVPNTVVPKPIKEEPLVKFKTQPKKVVPSKSIMESMLTTSVVKPQDRRSIVKLSHDSQTKTPISTLQSANVTTNVVEAVLKSPPIAKESSQQKPFEPASSSTPTKPSNIIRISTKPTHSVIKQPVKLPLPSFILKELKAKAEPAFLPETNPPKLILSRVPSTIVAPEPKKKELNFTQPIICTLKRPLVDYDYDNDETPEIPPKKANSETDPLESRQSVESDDDDVIEIEPPKSARSVTTDPFDLRPIPKPNVVPDFPQEEIIVPETFTVPVFNPRSSNSIERDLDEPSLEVNPSMDVHVPSEVPVIDLEDDTDSIVVIGTSAPTNILETYLKGSNDERADILGKPKVVDAPESMDFEIDNFVEDDASLMNEVSLPASLCENDDFSFVKPKSTEPADDIKLNISDKTGPVPFSEEDTQSSWSLDPNKSSKLKDTIDPASKVIDEECSVVSIGPKKPEDPVSLDDFPANKVFEYQWPQEKGEFYILQEQVCEYLGVKSFKRKHPDLPRRNVDKDERQFLREKNTVSETQCDLGLTALRSEDVMELMSKDYPDKYQEYVRALQEKQRLALALKAKEYAAANADKNKIKDMLKKAMKSAAEYNAHLNQERRDDRRMSFDLQTYTIHVPANSSRKLDSESTKVGKYPVAVIPGQYQDYYRKYTASELKYLPINTVLYGPLQELNTINVAPGSDGSQSDSDSDSEASCCSSSLGTQDGSGDSSSGSEMGNKMGDVYFKPKEVQSPCKICHGTAEQNKQGRPEDLILCSQCKTSAHPSCLELTTELMEKIKTYEWECLECKTCMLCMDPYDEEKMMFCDKCDRGFHTFCVGLKTLPKGRWICQLCGQCTMCGAKTPGPEGTKLQWQLAAGEGNKKPQLLCVACSKKKAK